ncbi:purple acid phosphatase family protein [Amycolatopsis benzoatilytica]|uniref:purple acid phosphatase family protein n=1 Tax=Amycolatopsis benzoatilytica TaxID=346045 RepID=UPI00037FD3EF|nr:metallophosphoesterase family protein [Amycolatopsis benzoatilytica]
MPESPRPGRSASSPRFSARPSLAEQHEQYVAQYSRRSLFRAGAAGGAVLAGGALLPGLATAAPAGADFRQAKDKPAGSAVRPFGRHLAFGADPSRQVVVSWQVPAAVTAPFVRIGLSPTDLGQQVPAEVRTLVSKLAWQHPVEDEPLVRPTTVTQYYLHASLDRLVPDTTYYYVVGHRGHDPAGDRTRLGDIASFHTAPAPGRGGPFTFTAFGDQGVGYNAAATTNLVAGLGSAFHVHMGDLSYANTEGGGNTTDKYDARVWDSFFVQNEPVASQTPWMMAIGNHEMEVWYSPDGYGGVRARFTMPDNAWGDSTGIYSWRYQNVGLISLDGNDICYNTPANLGYTKGKQLAFLKAKLAALRADPTIDFIVVYFHQCTYSTCADNGAELGAQTDWAPLFDKYQVDLVLNGHNHIYERTDPIRGGKATKKLATGGTVNPVKDGTTYVVAGGGGGGIYKFPASDTYLGHETPNDKPVPMVVSDKDGKDHTVQVTWSRIRYTGYCLVAVDAIPARPGKPARLNVRSVTEDGTEVDQFTVQRG